MMHGQTKIKIMYSLPSSSSSSSSSS